MLLNSSSMSGFLIAIWQISLKKKKKKEKKPYCDNLEGWNGVGGRFEREGAHVYLWLIHIDV